MKYVLKEKEIKLIYIKSIETKIGKKEWKRKEKLIIIFIPEYNPNRK